MENTELAGERPSLPERKPRVLIVDDDRSIRLLCATQLRREGYEVIEAQDGQEGLERALAESPDLILLDISMPILDGFGLAAALRTDVRTQRLPFVFISGELDPQTEARAYEAGAQGYFAKPFEPSAVGAFIRSTLLPLLPLPEPGTRSGGHAY